MFSWLLGRDKQNDVAQRLYRAIVEASRQPELYQSFGVPDTVDGRFDMIITHAIVVFRRLRDDGEMGKEFSQRVFDVMFDDMDAALRELGTGDMTVGKKIREMGEAFYGRAQAYEPVLEQGDVKAFAQALFRNLHANEAENTEVSPEQAGSAHDLASYFLKIESILETTDSDVFLRGELPELN